MFATDFPPQNVWLIVGGFLAMAALSIGLSFWVANRFGGSRMWVVGGMFLGGIAIASWHVGLLPLGVAVSAVVGCVASLMISSLNR